MAKLSKLTKFLDRLDKESIHYTLTSITEGAVTVGVGAPDQHWQIEFCEDGDIEVQVFESDGETRDFSSVKQLFEAHEDDDDDDDDD